MADEIRYGGPQADEGGDDAARKAQEREAKKAEVRRRLEEAGQKKKAKKGFLTPERKKKLRKLLMIKAAEDLKRQQLLKEQERVKILAQRTIPLPDVDSCDDKNKLISIYEDLFARVCKLEEEKWDINQLVASQDGTINALNIEVNDLRGKFVKPSLKKVSKYDNKFKATAQKSGEKADFRGNLKNVKKDNVQAILEVKKKSDKPEWSKKGKEHKEEAPKEEVKVEAAPVEEPPAEEEVVEEEEVEEEEEEEE
jgi:hypothetical protein